jgi:general secretion pathway protein K
LTVSGRTDRSRTPKRRGSALLAVLWMSAALAAIAFSLATTVRGETDRTATAVDDLRSYYLATGAIERAILDMHDSKEGYLAGQPQFSFEFPSGEAIVDVIPESAKLGINEVSPLVLLRLLIALGLDEDRAQESAAAILDWRTPVPPNGGGLFEGFYESQSPSFHARHASFEEIEELLSVKGISPDLYYGTYVRDTTTDPPQLVPRGGLRDCVSIYGGVGQVDVNGAAPATMLALGIPADAVQAIVQRRPFLKAQDYGAFAHGNPALAGLRYGGNSIFTLRATARLRLADGSLSDLRRTVSATVNFQVKGDPPIVVMRWYDRG